MTWIAYTDGACAPSNPGPAAWGLYLIAPGQTQGEEFCGFIGHGTNQIAELTAAIEGLSRVPAGAPVELVSDSQYVLKGLTEWRKGWERKGFRNAKGEPVANRALWDRLFALADARKVAARWVRGHAGDLHNERVDGLANRALREARAERVQGSPPLPLADKPGLRSVSPATSPGLGAMTPEQGLSSPADRSLE